MADGVLAVEGTAWDAPAAFVLGPTETSLVFQFDHSSLVQSLLIQADNNDTYQFEGRRLDGSYEVLGEVRPDDDTGLRTRSVVLPQPRGPFDALRITPHGGDGRYSVSEIVASCAPQLPPLKVRRFGTFFSTTYSIELVWLITVVLGAVLNALRPSKAALVLGGVATVLVTAYLGYVFWNAAELPRDAMQFQRALLAVSLILLGGIYQLRKTSRTMPAVFLGCVAIVAVCNFFSYGHRHFHRGNTNGGTWVHTFDMRIYYPTAKYFNELGYDGVYLASLGAYQEIRNSSWSELSQVRVRDLQNYSVETAGHLTEKIAAAKARFSPARWEAFVDDMRYFVDLMGDFDYLGTHADHGANASPAWMAIAHAIFSPFRASEAVLVGAGMLDVVLLGIAFVAIVRVFGWQLALFVVASFGATDFPYFGSNWVGATLRHDWLATLALGVCALKSRRYGLAGSLLAYSSMIRVFPVLAACVAALPLFAKLLRGGAIVSNFDRSALYRYGRGFIVTALILGMLPIALFGFRHSWAEWGSKIIEHANKPSVNNVGWRTVMAFDPDLVARRVMVPSNPEPWIRWQETQMQTLRENGVTYRGGQIIGLLAVGLLAWRAFPSQAALLGIALVPILSYPSNYYLHFFCLFPLLAYSWRDFRVGNRQLAHAAVMSLGVLFVIQYFTLSEPHSDECFTEQSAALLVALVIVLMAFGSWLRAGALRRF